MNFVESLEATYLKQSLSLQAQKILEGCIFVPDLTNKVVRIWTQTPKAITRNFQTLKNEPYLHDNFRKVEIHRGSERYCSLPLDFPPKSQIQVLPMAKSHEKLIEIDVSRLPKSTILEVQQELHNYGTQANEAASIVAMRDDFGWLCNEQIGSHSGLTLAETIRQGSNAKYFEEAELVRYKNALIEAAIRSPGQDIRLEYSAFMASTWEPSLFEVWGRLIILEGEVWRLIKLISKRSQV